MEATLMLCDWAEAINGKLYIQGGGWNQIPAGKPMKIALAVLIAVPWDQANRKITMTADLMTEDGVRVEVNDRAVHLEGGFEVGRPPGSTTGAPFNVPLVLRVDGLSLGKGAYRWELAIDGELVTTTRFETLA